MTSVKIFMPKWQRLMANIKETYINDNARKCKLNYDTVFLLIRLFKKRGWVTLKREGRETRIRLTKQGKEVKDACLRVIQWEQ